MLERFGRWLGWRKKPISPGPFWILVPLGNPGDAYASTRHNLGRLMLQRWMAAHCPRPGSVHAFKTGTLYSLSETFVALVPGTYMNLSGQVCEEAMAAGFDPARFILLHDDKDLPLGLGRFRLSGSDGGHNGLRSIFERLGTQDIPRLRLGIGPFQRPLDQFVLGEWTEGEWTRIEAMDKAFGRFMEALGEAKELHALPGIVNSGKFWDEPSHSENLIEPQGNP